MFDPLLYLLAAVMLLTLFFGTVPLIIALKLGDRARLDRLLDLYTEVFAHSASAIIGALRIFRRKETPPPLPVDDKAKLSPPNST
jgi:hypothetical protein